MIRQSENSQCHQLRRLNCQRQSVRGWPSSSFAVTRRAHTRSVTSCMTMRVPTAESADKAHRKAEKLKRKADKQSARHQKYAAVVQKKAGQQPPGECCCPVASGCEQSHRAGTPTNVKCLRAPMWTRFLHHSSLSAAGRNKWRVLGSMSVYKMRCVATQGSGPTPYLSW